MQSIKGSANREEYKEKPKFSLNFRGAAYLRDAVAKVQLSYRITKPFDMTNA